MTHGETVDWAGEIRRLRRSSSLKQLALAGALGVDQATVSRWERGISVPDLVARRRLRDLLRRAVPEEMLLKHSVHLCPGVVVLSNEERVMQAVSPGYALAHGIPQHLMPGRSNRGKFGSVEMLVDEIAHRGFYRGHVASVTVICRAPSLSGHRAPMPIRLVWSPVRIGNDTWLRGDRIDLPEAEFERAVARNGGPLRIVMMDELVQ
jgi:transcriptional regulator with XRE-family HTH domain